MSKFLVGSLLAALGLSAGCAPQGEHAPREEARRLSAVRSLSQAPSNGFARAFTPRAFVFPEDHGPHPDFQTEWWYVTGNLDARSGRRFGYQLTFFRSALVPPSATSSRASAWAADQIYMAHLAVTDAAAGRFHAFERFSRAALGLAGAEAAPLRVWLEDWELQASADLDDTAQMPPLELHAAGNGVELDLRLTSQKPIVLHGEGGLSRKGLRPGSASYYYSATRLATSGWITSGSEEIEVDGFSWMDREWSTSVLEKGQVGWDWFSLQLDDGRDLMVFHIRRNDGVDAIRSGTLVGIDGSATQVAADDIELEVLSSWTSSETGAVYPARWRLRLKASSTELEITPLLADQEHRGSFVYWEGAVSVTGTADGRPVAGRGFAELTGYSDGQTSP